MVGKVGQDPGMDSMPQLNRMWAWQATCYGEPMSVLRLHKSVTMPTIKKPTQIIVKILAASVNPVDILMVRGYGSQSLQNQRDKLRGGKCCFKKGREFPLTLGRDIAGIVIEMGSAVRRFEIGDHVYGYVPILETGGHAEYCLVDRDWMQSKPVTLSFTDAVAIPYSAMTVWYSLRGLGNSSEFKDKNFLIIGAASDVGLVAIQYLKCKEAKVTVMCPGTSFTFMNDLGVNFMVDERDKHYLTSVENHGPYDCIFDLTTKEMRSKSLLDFIRRGDGQYIALKPLESHNPKNENVLGRLKNNWHSIWTKIDSYFRHRVAIKYGHFGHDIVGWKEMSDLVKEEKIKPTIEQVYKFQELPQAHSRLARGNNLKGKIVLETKY